MKYRILVSQKAVDDVVRNAEWWASNYSHEQAARWEEAIFEKIYSLDRFPASHALAHENPDFPFELREAHFGLGARPGYRILFTIADDVVNVLTVKAAEEDWLGSDEFKA